MKKELIAIMGMTGMLLAMYLMLAFYSISFNIATWTDGTRVAFTFVGCFVLAIGIAGIAINRIQS